MVQGHGQDVLLFALGVGGLHVVQDVGGEAVVGEHDPLWEASGARGEHQEEKVFILR